MPPGTAIHSATPAVSTRLTATAFRRRRSKAGSSISFTSARMASQGMVNSAMTRMDDTARNLSYIGT